MWDMKVCKTDVHTGLYSYLEASNSVTHSVWQSYHIHKSAWKNHGQQWIISEYTKTEFTYCK